MERVVQLLALLGAMTFSLAAGSAHASGFHVAPTSLTFGDDVPSSMVTVTSRSHEPERFHILVFAWAQAADGEMLLTATEDLVFFPAMFVLQPGEARNVRVASTVAQGDDEKCYRLFVRQLPALQTLDAGGGSAVGVLTQIAIPVFVAPAGPGTAPVRVALSLEGTTLKVGLTNQGNMHTRPERVLVVVRHGEDVIHTEELSGWYILAGDTRDYFATLPTTACSAATSIAVELTSAQVATMTVLSDLVCAP